MLRWDHQLSTSTATTGSRRRYCDDLVARAAQPPPEVDEARLAAAVGAGARRARQRRAVEAAETAVRRWTTILTGGPGTGKTTTVARMLALLADQAAARGEPDLGRADRPTGKAASRLQEAVTAELAGLSGVRRPSPCLGHPQGVTLHRLLGWRPDNATRFRHDRGNRLKHDVVVVDESSMVELTMMARLLEALRPDSRLILVGDPEQLTSVGAGAVLSDLVRGYAGRPTLPSSS